MAIATRLEVIASTDHPRRIRYRAKATVGLHMEQSENKRVPSSAKAFPPALVVFLFLVASLLLLVRHLLLEAMHLLLIASCYYVGKTVCFFLPLLT